MTVNVKPGHIEIIDSMGSAQRVVDAARVSIGGQKPKLSDTKLLEYLWRQGHTSPFEHVVITFRIDAPIFTARQIMRHRTFSYNEISGRYSELPMEFYKPLEFYSQNKKNKQGTESFMELEGSDNYLMNNLFKQAETAYLELLKLGVAREQARMVLPVSVFTSFYMTGNFLNWVKFLKLRLDDHAQYEVWYIANQINRMIRFAFPKLWEVVKEDINATPEIMAGSKNYKRFIRETWFSPKSIKNPEDSSAHSEEVPQTLRDPAESGPDKREA